MDREQEEMQFLGLFGIYKESCKIIFTWRKIFTQITLALILPLSFIFLIHMEVSDLLVSKIGLTEVEMDETRFGSPTYNKLAQLASKEWTAYLIFEAAYFTFLLVFSLLSTSAVVYTIACAYTGRAVDFRKVVSVVPRVWKRLMATFLSIFIGLLCYNMVSIIVLIFWAISIGSMDFGIFLLFVLLGLYIVGFVYMTIVWQLACVVSVLEEDCGVKAMIKSRELLRGNMGVAVVIFFKLNTALVLIELAFGMLVIDGESSRLVSRIGYGILCFLLLVTLILFGLVVQAVLYFVCKSYHHENIDKSALSDHLEVYLGEYVPLKSKDVQLEQYHV
ncbi:uncharacterized protein LOC116188752 [Punica granatum]|uniref:Uncharacterized protein LOC116188752 n=2 Tax=Punica granatum TaxID=22663 RepID=A0A6P8BTA5_PUNGR|nr:uncharacterized protein LOC116188752 [Punica granatum]PKI50558.1 hypothetical protein CRG98_029064 [Punica granatum]